MFSLFRKKKPPEPEPAFGMVAVIAMLGLVFFGYIDKDSRLDFVEMARLVLAAYVGYMIPYGK